MSPAGTVPCFARLTEWPPGKSCPQPRSTHSSVRATASRARCSAITSSPARESIRPASCACSSRMPSTSRSCGRTAALRASSSASTTPACSKVVCRIVARSLRTSSVSATAAAPSSPSTTPTISRRSSRTSTCTCSAKATTTASTTSSARTRGARRPRRHALRGVGAQRRARQRRRSVQPLGRPQARDADPWLVRHLGTVHSGRRARHGLQVRDPHAQRAHGAESGPVRIRDAAAARQLLRGRGARRPRVAGPGLDGRPALPRTTPCGRSTSTSCTPARGSAATSGRRRSRTGASWPTS